MALIVSFYIILIFMNGDGNIYTQNANVFEWRSILRGISGMSVGIIIAASHVNAKISRIKWLLFSVLMIIHLYLMAWRDGYSRTDILVYVLIALGIVICKSTSGMNTNITVAVQLFGKASYNAFIIHYPIIGLIDYYRLFDGMDWKIYSMIFAFLIWILALMCHEIAITIN